MGGNRTLRPKFKVKKFKWYLVDLTNFHNPILVRKHLDNKFQAEWFKEKYYGDKFEVISWKDAKKHNINPHISYYKTHINHATKYDYPDKYNTNSRKRHAYRDLQRKKARQIMRLPKVTETAVWEIIDDKPILFVKRMKYYADNHWVFTEPVEGLKEFQKRFSWPKDLRHLCNIVRILREYYDVGLYPIHKVAFFIYKKWGARIRKHCDKYPQVIPSDKEKVRFEFLARGFIPLHSPNFGPGNSYIKTIHLTPVLVHPEICWHTGTEMGLYEHRLFDFQAKMGIPGYTQAYQAGIEKRNK